MILIIAIGWYVDAISDHESDPKNAQTDLQGQTEQPQSNQLYEASPHTAAQRLLVLLVRHGHVFTA